MTTTNRREILWAAASLGLPCCEAAAAPAVPAFLKGYEKTYRGGPRAATTEWFREAKFGLFLHYGLYSLLGRHEWVQLRELIPVTEYAKLKAQFRAEKFDAGFIASLASDAGMKYVNITTRHHDSFCLFRTRYTGFNSVNSPARRDLVEELAKACDKMRLGLCLYYSHGRDWKHPHAPNNDEWGGNARPKYDPPEPSYAYGSSHDLQKYLDFMHGQIEELLTNYGPLAAIWLDGIAVPLSRDKSKFRCQELYDFVHSKQPQVLVSYKQGLLGTEDFLAPEHKAVAEAPGKPMEICSTLQERTWGYHKTARRLGVEEAWAKLADARRAKANLLLNTGPLGDGSIHPDDVKTLREMGRRIRASGFPA